jgi:REP element-mobilizing transposase RayT
MSEKYTMRDPEGYYFLTETIVGWVDLFTRKDYSLLITDSLKHCQQNKNLRVHGYCIMHSHLHMIVSTTNQVLLGGIIRDFKSYTARKIIDLIKSIPESRREFLLTYFANAARLIKRVDEYKVWQDGSHPVWLQSKEFFRQKLDYIHDNPVEAMIVSKPEDYIFSSARNYCGEKGLMDIYLLDNAAY